MAKKLSKKELQKLELQMGISKIQHDRPPVLEGQPCSMVRPISRNGEKERWRRRSENAEAIKGWSLSFFAKKQKRHRFRDVLGFFNLSHLHIRCVAVCIQHVKYVWC